MIKISLDWPLLGKILTRNQGLMILQKNVCRKDICETTQENKEQQPILSSDKARTAGKGCAESKKAAINAGISC
jgi:hypothetical protein